MVKEMDEESAGEEIVRHLKPVDSVPEPEEYRTPQGIVGLAQKYLYSHDEIVGMAEDAEMVLALAGVYLLLRDNVVVYVGKSVNVYSRLASHDRDPKKDFDAIAVIHAPPGLIALIEQIYIHAFMPEYNNEYAGPRPEPVPYDKNNPDHP